jgi:hypothetical protein
MEERVKNQFPSLFITLVSILIGLEFADLVQEAEARMILWPITPITLRTWAQIAAMGTSALVVWVVYSHIGIVRRSIPSMSDSLVAFVVPIPLLIGNTLIGRETIWPWLYYAGFYLGISLLTVRWLGRMVRAEHESFSRITRPAGIMLVFYAGVPAYFAMGWACQHGWLSPWMEVVCAGSPAPTALFAIHIFLRDWRQAVAEASA